MCEANKWNVPNLKVPNPNLAYKEYNKRLAKNARKSKARITFFVVLISACAIIFGSVLLYSNYMQSHSKLPFTTSRVIGKDYDETEKLNKNE